MSKKKSRQAFTAIWEGISPSVLEDISLKVCRLIQESREWKDTDQVLAYLSFGKEVSLDILIRESLNAGKKVGIPLIESRETMSFRELKGWHPEIFILNRWGIREPSPETPIITARPGSLILVPGLGFSLEGHRMGRGGGFYDRYLTGADLSGCFLMGISCEAALNSQIPTDIHDIPVKAVCTEKRIIRP